MRLNEQGLNEYKDRIRKLLFYYFNKTVVSSIDSESMCKQIHLGANIPYIFVKLGLLKKGENRPIRFTYIGEHPSAVNIDEIIECARQISREKSKKSYYLKKKINHTVFDKYSIILNKIKYNYSEFNKRNLLEFLYANKIQHRTEIFTRTLLNMKIIYAKGDGFVWNPEFEVSTKLVKDLIFELNKELQKNNSGNGKSEMKAVDIRDLEGRILRLERIFIEELNVKVNEYPLVD